MHKFHDNYREISQKSIPLGIKMVFKQKTCIAKGALKF
jgi:hypothetical protein